MVYHIDLEKHKLRSLIKNEQIVLAGNKGLKIYGTLSCKSGKRMNKENRVFFISQTEAINKDYRPCAHCMAREYKKWQRSNTN